MAFVFMTSIQRLTAIETGVRPFMPRWQRPLCVRFMITNLAPRACSLVFRCSKLFKLIHSHIILQVFMQVESSIPLATEASASSNILVAATGVSLPNTIFDRDITCHLPRRGCWRRYHEFYYLSRTISISRAKTQNGIISASALLALWYGYHDPRAHSNTEYMQTLLGAICDLGRLISAYPDLFPISLIF